MKSPFLRIWMPLVLFAAAAGIFLFDEMRDLRSENEALRAEQTATVQLLAEHHAVLNRMQRSDRGAAFTRARLQLAQSHDSTVNSSVFFDSSNFVQQEEFEDFQDELEDELEAMEARLTALIQQSASSGNVRCLSGQQLTRHFEETGVRMNFRVPTRLTPFGGANGHYGIDSGSGTFYGVEYLAQQIMNNGWYMAGTAPIGTPQYTTYQVIYCGAG